jgi:SAM-dependent methyltransferase
MTSYVHGYSHREAARLQDQAQTLAALLHHDTVYRAGSLVLECGCGTGAQTQYLAQQSPLAHFIAIDRAADSLNQAQAMARDAALANVQFQQADIFNLPFAAQTFDHIFICFVLEHLPAPQQALEALKQVLKPHGSMTVIEGDHGSWYCYPETPAARRVVQCLVGVQARMQGNAMVGRQLYPLLRGAGFENVVVVPKCVYVDASRPQWVEGFSKQTFIAMVEGVREQALALGLIDDSGWQQGIDDLYRATGPDGTFNYTFFKAVAMFHQAS